MADERVALFKERMAKLRDLRERTGAPLSLCDQALKASRGDVEAAAKDSAVMAARGVDTGDPRHHCRDDCPPWPFAWGRRDARGHWCNTHCAQHPDPMSHSLALARELIDGPDDVVEKVLRLCGWNVVRAVQFMWDVAALGDPRA